MATALVTGGAGFAGRHLVERLGGEAVAPPRSELDLLDREAVAAAVRATRPDRVFHLAAIASTARSWRDPGEVLQKNVAMTLNLLEAVRSEAPDARVLVASSGQVYGAPVRLPVTEEDAVRPLSPYGVSKAACELLAGQYADAHGLHVVRTRAFNHAGPRQSDEYLLGTLTRQVAEAEHDGREELTLRTGDLDAVRDFTDVRDVVRAYVEAVELAPGAYNVCSGQGVSGRELVELVRGCTALAIRTEVDPERMRPSEIPDLRGSAELLRSASGWEPEIALEQTVRDALEEWRHAIPPARPGSTGRTTRSPA